MAQVEAFAAHRGAPKMLCAACEEKLGALEDKPVPCAVPGCTRTATFSKRAQLIAGAPDVELTAPPTMCTQCEGVFRKLKDRQVTCGINGCKNKWAWSRDEQIQAYATGQPNEPPRRMCTSCEGVFGSIADREVRCRTSGCKKTWTWSRSDQLDACVAGKPAPKAPPRMCQSCHDIFSKLKDVERPCRRSGCKRTWTDKRGAQLARAVRGKSGDPYPHYCTECEKELGDLEDRQIACKTDGCTGTWTWTRAQQLAAGVRPKLPEPAPEATAEVGPNGETVVRAPAPEPSRKKRRREPRPPDRRCDACIEFLKGRTTREIPCKQCGTPIYWPPESQLQTHLGHWAEPTLCGACKRDATEAARAAQRLALRNPQQGEGGHDAPADVSNGGSPAETSEEIQAQGGGNGSGEAEVETVAEAPAAPEAEPAPPAAPVPETTPPEVSST